MFIFFDFSFDDFAEGGGFILKFLITLALVAVPIIFVRDFDNNVVYGTIGFSIAVATIITNLIFFVIRGLEIKKEKSDIKRKKLINYFISLLLFVVLSIIGYFCPFTIFKLTFKGFAGLSILPIISSLVMAIITSDKFITKKSKIFNYILPAVGMIISIAFMASILFFAMTFYHRFGIQDGDYKDTKFGNSAKAVFEYIEENVKYYDSSFDSNRKDEDIKVILQKNIDRIIELSTNEEEVQKLGGLMKLSSGETDQLKQDKLYFLTTYTNSKTSMKEFKEKYGLNIQFRSPFARCEKYKQYRILTTYDKAAEKTHFYLFNTETFKITEEIPKNEYQDYVNNIIMEAKNNHEYN